MVKKSRRRRKAEETPTTAQNVEWSIASQPQDTAIRLLYLQQRLEALERLFGDEVVRLKQELTEVNRNFVRQAQAQGRLHISTGGDATDGGSDDEDDDS